MKKKTVYRVRNWKEYNKALVQRGNITLWFDNNAINHWSGVRSGGRGRPQSYSDICILLCLLLRYRFHLTLRAVQGFMEGILALMELNLPVPHYSRLCRRAKGLRIDYARKLPGPIDIVVDSTGLKVYGEGEWKMRVHGKSKRRTWRKLHLAVEPSSFEIISMKLTECNKTDGKVFPTLIKDIPRIGNAYADAAYMGRKCFESIDSKGGKAIIDLRGGTSLARGPTPGLKQRNRIVREIWDSGHCKKTWKKKSGYHRRSLAETMMFRFKKLLGSSLSSRKMTYQESEARIKSMLLGQMTRLGMPKTLPIPAP